MDNLLGFKLQPFLLYYRHVEQCNKICGLICSSDVNASLNPTLYFIFKGDFKGEALAAFMACSLLSQSLVQHT